MAVEVWFPVTVAGPRRRVLSENIIRMSADHARGLGEDFFRPGFH